jgi:hypothetical protein
MAKKVIRKFTPDELAKAAEHIAFEIRHFRCYAELKDDHRLSEICPAATQAVGYALLMHLRVLIEFFFCEPEQDDCHVVHFRELPGFTKGFPPSIHEQTSRTDEVARHLNKLMAHFTATRWEKRRPPWDYYDEYAPAIRDLASRFESALTGNVRAAYYKGYKKWGHHTSTVSARPKS